MTNLMPSSESGTPINITELCTKLNTDSEKNQLQVIQSLGEAGEQGWQELMKFLAKRQPHLPSVAAGKAYQMLFQADSLQVTEYLQTQFPQGIVPLQSEVGVDYCLLQELLVKLDFQAADKLTLEKVCELAGSAAMERGWLYFSEVRQFPRTDLRTIDTLWQVYSEGKFGYSVQRKLWLSLDKNWDKLWPKINWRKAGVWTRYPQEFTWDLTAPPGHLPLSNQLRGVRVMEA
ncbi:MAG: GUN4 N-terminal ARM-like repeat domain-containing protein, partial [Microcoleaceae cyanobacterium]